MNDLFTNQTTDDVSGLIEWNGGPLVVHVVGTMDGASLSIDLNSGIGWVSNTDLTMTVTGAYQVTHVKPGTQVRATLTGAGASTNISVRAM